MVSAILSIRRQMEHRTQSISAGDSRMKIFLSCLCTKRKINGMSTGSRPEAGRKRTLFSVVFHELSQWCHQTSQPTNEHILCVFISEISLKWNCDRVEIFQICCLCVKNFSRGEIDFCWTHFSLDLWKQLLRIETRSKNEIGPRVEQVIQVK